MESESKTVEKAMEPLFEIWEQRSQDCRLREKEIEQMIADGRGDELRERFKKIEERDKKVWEELNEKVKREGGWINDVFYRGNMTDEEVKLMGGHEAKIFVGKEVVVDEEF